MKVLLTKKDLYLFYITQINSYYEHTDIFVKAQIWSSLDVNSDSQCIFLILSLKDGELLKRYSESISIKSQLTPIKIAENGFKFAISETGIKIINGPNYPEGLSLPFYSYSKEFTFNQIIDESGIVKDSKKSKEYCESVYRMILRLDSLMIDIAEGK